MVIHKLLSDNGDFSLNEIKSILNGLDKSINCDLISKILKKYELKFLL